MKAILLRQPGGPSALEYVELPTPVPGDGEVLVQADTIGVSMPEVLVRKGVYNWMPPLPAIPGIEMSGTVVAHGRNVAAPAIGQPVFVSARDLPVRAGCYAEYIAVPARAAHPVAAGLLARSGGVPVELPGGLSCAALRGARGRGRDGADPQRGRRRRQRRGATRADRRTQRHRGCRE